MKWVTIYAKANTRKQNVGLTVENKEYDLAYTKAVETDEHERGIICELRGHI